jgi:transcriptional regulator with XRE-family HTH domain
MKRTKEDRSYGLRFSLALQPHVSREVAEGKSLAEIAAALGVTAAGLQKQLAGGTPSIRTVAFAHSIYGVAVPYEGVDVVDAIGRPKKRKRVSEEQLLLPFEITASPASKRLSLKLISKSQRRYQLRVVISASA